MVSYRRVRNCWTLHNERGPTNAAPIFHRSEAKQAAVRSAARKRCWIGIVDKSFHLLRRRRQSGQIIIGTADQLLPGRLRSRFQADLLQAGQNEIVDFVARPLLLSDLGHVRSFDWLERPPTFGFLIDLRDLGTMLGSKIDLVGCWQRTVPARPTW